ncbi:MAG: hypothetical protein KAT70_02685 [Thermoplasmata archaeon]|nr:hypothetical protein [Thermoplasmata archaeon]
MVRKRSAEYNGVRSVMDGLVWALIICGGAALLATLIGCSSMMKTTTVIRKPAYTTAQMAGDLYQKVRQICEKEDPESEIRERCMEAMEKAFGPLVIVCQVDSKGDAMVQHIDGDETCTVDNRGAPSVFERVIEYVMTKPNFNIGGKE